MWLGMCQVITGVAVALGGRGMRLTLPWHQRVPKLLLAAEDTWSCGVLLPGRRKKPKYLSWKEEGGRKGGQGGIAVCRHSAAAKGDGSFPQ